MRGAGRAHVCRGGITAVADRAPSRIAHLVYLDAIVPRDGETLFDRTMVLYGSNLGNANTHVTTNLPTLFAGRGFRHGPHLAFDRERN